MTMNMDIYAKELLDHYKKPKNLGKIDNPDFVTQEYNPSCGDRIQIFGKIKNGKIEQISFLGEGCVISLATASMLTEFIKDKSTSEVLKLNSDDIIKLIKIKPGPTRLKCALLPLYAIQSGVKKLEEKS